MGEGVALWLAASFRDPARDWRDVPLCIRSRSTAFVQIEGADNAE